MRAKAKFIMVGKIIIRLATLADAEMISRVRIKIWQETYQGIIDQGYLDNMSVEKGTIMWQGFLSSAKPETICLVAMNGEVMVGFCSAGPNRNTKHRAKGKIYALNLLEGYKGIGVGLQLFNQARDHIARQQLLPFLVWVLPENKSACRFYEKHNGVSCYEEMIKIGEKEYREIGYLFDQ